MIPFEKYHGAGNDFLLVDVQEADLDADGRRALAIRECDRETGVGADGMLFLDLQPGDPVRVSMALYQPDGSTAAMCGNGARCAAMWAAELTGATEVIVDTPAGERRARLLGEEVTVEMGTPSFVARDIPLDRDEPIVEEHVEGLVVTAVNTGVPHAVAFVDDVDDVDLARLAPSVRHAPVFPEGANVTFAAPQNGGFRQRTFERGVEAETVACGTGAVAIAAVARRKRLIAAGEQTVVSPPGGDLLVVIRADGSASLRGPVAYVSAGEVAPP